MGVSILKYMAFVKTVEYGSFTKAGEALGYTQSGISRMIRDLEKEWNIVLLERSRAGVRLTSDGTKLLPYAVSLCSEYELLLGDYTEIEDLIAEGRVDCGFVRLPTRPEFETIFLEQDRLLAVLPEGHPLADCETIPVEALCDDPFMLLEKGAKAEVSEIFERNGLAPRVQFTTWDDYAIMSMVEGGLGISILPELILKRNPYRILTKELNPPAYRQIAQAMKSLVGVSAALRRFLEYLPHRGQDMGVNGSDGNFSDESCISETGPLR